MYNTSNGGSENEIDDNVREDVSMRKIDKEACPSLVEECCLATHNKKKNKNDNNDNNDDNKMDEKEC